MHRRQFLTFILLALALIYPFSGWVLGQGANPRFIYVSGAYEGEEDGSAAHPYNTISEALAAAREGDQIRVAGGAGIVYTELLQVLQPVHLQGGYDAQSWERDVQANETVIDGDGQGTVVTIGPWPLGRQDIIFEGFTIRNGRAPRGGGILISQASPNLFRNRIMGNVAFEAGGGISIRDASPQILDNDIEANAAPGAGGGGIHVAGSRAFIANNRILANDAGEASGGGVKVEGGSVVVLTRNIIADNSARHGAGVYVSGPAQVAISNSVIYLNRASGRGGALAVDGAVADLINTTVISNTSDGLTVLGTTTPESSPAISVTNSIVWGHTGNDLVGQGFVVRYSDIEQGLLPGPGNLSVDPALANVQDFDFHLLPHSPLVDAGTDEVLLQTDFEGDQRFYDGNGDHISQVDIGADELAANLDASIKNVVFESSLPTPGGTLTYLITLVNGGRVGAPAAILTDTLSPLLTCRPASLRASGGTCSLQEGAIVWRGPISTTLPVTITFVADVSGEAVPSESIVNVAQISYGADTPWSIFAVAIITEKRSLYLPLVLSD